MNEKEILRQRARAAARVPPRDDSGPHIEAVEFRLANECYAVETAFVKEVLALRELTSLPGVPDFIAGLVNVRGRIVGVVDLKTFFDLPPRGLPEVNRVLVVGDGEAEFGLLVDGVVGVVRLQADALQPPLPTLTEVREQYLRGLTSQGLALLDAARILHDPRIVVNDAPA